MTAPLERPACGTDDIERKFNIMKQFLVKCKALLDGTGAQPIENAGMLVEDGLVKAVGPYDAVRAQAPADVELVDYSGKYVMPGIIDVHTHVIIDPEADFTGFVDRGDSDTAIAYRGMVNLKKTLDGGVTFIRDLGGYHFIDVELKKLLDAGKIEGCGMLAAGQMITMTGGHGWKLGRQADGISECRKAAREQILHGASYVKIMSSGGDLTPGPAGAPQLSSEEIRAAVEEAHKAGLRTTTHSHSAEAIKNALDAGIDCIEHGMFIDEADVDYMVEHNIPLVPTLVAPWICAEQGEEKGLPMDAVIKCKSAVSRHVESFKLALRKGVKMAMGTDAGTPFCDHGAAYVDNLILQCRYGMTPMQSLLTATRNAAEVIGIDEDYGTLESGKHADFLVLNDNPLDSFETLRHIAEVYQFGKRVVRQYYI